MIRYDAKSTRRRTRKAGWLSLAFAVTANSCLFLVIAYVNQRYTGEAQDVLAKPIDVYVPPPDQEAPPPEEEREIAEPEAQPEALEPLDVFEAPPPLMPRLDFDMPDLDDPNAVAVAVTDLDVQNVSMPTGPMDLPDVDRPPSRTSGRMPAYPQWAMERELEARMTVEFVVAADGRVQNVRVVNLVGDERFRKLAIDTVRKWRFQPATFRGTDVPVRCFKKLRFRLEG